MCIDSINFIYNTTLVSFTVFSYSTDGYPLEKFEKLSKQMCSSTTNGMITLGLLQKALTNCTN